MTTLYRTHRPESFADVVGQDTAVSELRSLLASGNFPHASILVGTRGIGKTTLARIIARELGCDPVDVYELDAASNRKIDDIRRLRDTVATLPIASPKKVYILDEVHMLTTESWNALLKTLEEPPQHVVFIMATTEAHAIPDTIVSRSRVIRLKSPTISDLSEYLMNVAHKESYLLGSDACEIIAVSANNSYRDALVSLQSVIASNITASSEISRMLGVPSVAQVRLWLGALYHHDAREAITIAQSIIQEGTDSALFLDMAITRVRWALAHRIGLEQADIPDSDKELIDTITKGAQPVQSYYLSHLIESLRMVKSVPHPSILLELVTYKILDQGATPRS
jgi:DNA polymerase-3 subunit gamma/tau